MLGNGFQEGPESKTHVARTERPSANEEQVQAVTALLIQIDVRRYMSYEEIGLTHATLLHIQKNLLRIRELHPGGFPKIWRKLSDVYDTTPLKLTWSIMV